jgi:hypothetical protein
MTDNALVPMTALERLRKKAENPHRTADDLTRSMRRSLLLVDVSSSMGGTIRTGERKIDALRTVVDKVRSTHPVPLAAFPQGGYNRCELVDNVPEPRGMTPLAQAIQFGHMQEATHLVVVTDGVPDSQQAAFDAARAFGGPIDVFYIGDGNDHGATFCEQLAKLTGGKCGVTDLVGDPKLLAGKIAGLLGDGR